MKQIGTQTLEELLIKLEREDGYTFEKAWKLAEDVPVCAIPITIKVAHTRDYYVLPEVQDKVTLTDTGGISGVGVKNQSDRPVFIKGGTILQGEGTQSRAPNTSIMVSPQKEEIINVSCIHASHGITPKAAFHVRGVVPRRTEHALRFRSQPAVWDSVHTFATYAAQSLSSIGMRLESAQDNLAGLSANFEKLDDRVKMVIERFPNMVNQLGVVIVSLSGVEGLELFDHPESWKAMNKHIAKKYSETYVQRDKTGVFKIDEDKARQAAVDFIKKIKELKETVAHQDGYSTFVLQGEGISGEYTIFHNRVVHLTASAIDKPVERQWPRSPLPDRERHPSPRPGRRWTEWGTPAVTTDIFGKRGAPKIYKYLTDKPKTWTDLLSRTRLPRSTLTRRLSEGQERGLIHTMVRENGKVVYGLSEIGEKQFKEAKKSFVAT